MIRLPFETWTNIFKNVHDAQLEQLQEEGVEELIKEGIEQRIEVEVVWLDSTDEWCLCCGTELFEDGFQSEKEAQDRLDYLEHQYHIWFMENTKKLLDNLLTKDD